MYLFKYRISRYLFFLVVAAVTIYFLFLVREVALSFILGGVLAYLLFRPISYIEKKGLKRVWAILLLYLLLLAALTLFFSFAIPAIVRELGQVASLLPEYAEQLQIMLDKVEKINMPEKVNEILNQNLEQVEKSIYQGLNNFVGSFYNFLNMILALIFSPILAFYIINDWEKIKEGFLNLFSPSARHDFVALSKEIDTVLIEFLKGHFMVAGFVGTMVGVSAALIGVELPLLIGILSGLSNFIPYFGAFLGGVPAVLLAMSESLGQGIYMAIAIFIIQQIEGSIITPRIVGDKLGMHPLLIVFALLAGGKLLGIWGMILAVPLAAVLKILSNWVYLKAVEKV
jgi:predicted PurR-regulated permease PerM